MMPVSYAFYYVVLLNLVLSSAKDASDLCSGKAGIEWVHDPSECQSFYMCVNKQALKYVCPGNQVWNNRQKLCTPKGSPLDICTPLTTTLAPLPTLPIPQSPSFKSLCTNGVRSAHKDNCAQYYECAAKQSGGRTEPQLMECPYPLMYDEDKKSCQFPKKVKCGGRYPPMDPCEYTQNQCISANCVPCHLRFPSCRGKPDGLHPWTGKEWTPNYIVCDQERVTYTGMCETDRMGRRKLFHPNQKACIERIIIQYQI